MCFSEQISYRKLSLGAPAFCHSVCLLFVCNSWRKRRKSLFWWRILFIELQLTRHFTLCFPLLVSVWISEGLWWFIGVRISDKTLLLAFCWLIIDVWICDTTLTPSPFSLPEAASLLVSGGRMTKEAPEDEVARCRISAGGRGTQQRQEPITRSV